MCAFCVFVLVCFCGAVIRAWLDTIQDTGDCLLFFKVMISWELFIFPDFFNVTARKSPARTRGPLIGPLWLPVLLLIAHVSPWLALLNGPSFPSVSLTIPVVVGPLIDSNSHLDKPSVPVLGPSAHLGGLSGPLFCLKAPLSYPSQVTGTRDS